MAEQPVKVDLTADLSAFADVLRRSVKVAVAASRRLSATGLDLVSAAERDAGGPHRWPGDDS